MNKFAALMEYIRDNMGETELGLNSMLAYIHQETASGSTVTRHVRLANLPMKFRIEERLNKQAKEARKAKVQQTPKERRAEQLEKAREVRSAKCEAANRVSAKDYVGNGKFTQRAYTYMNKVYPRWITSEDLVEKTGINKSTVSIIFYNMNGRGHLDKMKQSGKGRLRFKLYRLVLE